MDEYTTTTYEYPDHTIVRIHRPILTEEEREARMEEVKRAAAHFLTEVIKEKNKNNENWP